VERKDQQGILYKEILSTQSFPTFEAATDYVSQQKTGNHKIASSSLSGSPVSLDRLDHYKLVYTSKPPPPAMIQDASGQTLQFRGPVKIFEYIK
jgi:hypothetical protein